MGFDETRTGLLVEKRLLKVWTNKEYKAMGIRKENTLIVDDIPLFCRKNYGNAIYVPTFQGQPDDNVLILLASYLKQIIKHENVRGLNKLNWMNEV